VPVGRDGMGRVTPVEVPPTDTSPVARALVLAGELSVRAAELTPRREGRRRAAFQRLLDDPGGTRFVFSLADRVLRPEDPVAAAGQLAVLARGDLAGTSALDRVLLKAGGMAGRIAPSPVVRLAGARLRRETRELVGRSEPPTALGRRLGRQWSAGRRPNLNLLGEAVLGWEEARRRAAAVEALLRRPDVDCVSVKASSIAAGLSLVDFDGSVARIREPLVGLYRAALESNPPKLVNLDMEEHRDLDLTLGVFMSVLDRPEFVSLGAGIALQAYLPDTHGALDRLLQWAAERVASGGSPIRVRLVKGANLAMERVEAEVHGWPPAPYDSKAETDASYKVLLERLIGAGREGSVRIGVASHNLFDVALALVLAEDAAVLVEVEMLSGMADAEARAVGERVGRMIFYLPITSRRDFRNALAYLARRLDENATPEGFLRHASGLRPGTEPWRDQAARFERAYAERGLVGTRPHQRQDRSMTAGPRAGDRDGWHNEPDTDLTVPANRRWAVRLLTAAVPSAPPPATEEEVERAVAAARGAAPDWSDTPGEARRRLLLAAAESLASARADAVAVMAAEAGKTFLEADTEVSEAVDYARWYARDAVLADSVGDTVGSVPLGVVVVTPPWNFPFAIPAGGMLAALAAGNTVIVKPSPEAPGTSDLLVRSLWSAGFGAEQVQLVAAPDGPVGRRLVTHPDVNGVVLTGSIETARLFARWAPGRRLLAETSGKNALVIGATADVDQAVADLVRSAFGHAGQKCSAASVAIVHRSILDKTPFLRQLADATRSLRVGPATDPATEVGPIVGPMTPALERALTRLDDGERWLVEPEVLDAGRRLWRPGVRVGVRAGSWAHLTEWFGPVLAVMAVDDLAEAIGAQNSVAFGLTAGLHSLDPGEHARWADAVEAGNLYINRPTTGAIVGRQPFGGWKASSLGPTAKAGGPHYLIGLRRWRDAGPVTVADAQRSYRQWWDSHFLAEHELAGLRSESNVLRYRPYTPGVIVRAADGASDDDLSKAAAVAALTGTPIEISSASGRAGSRGDCEVSVEGPEGFADRLAGRPGARVRLLGAVEPAVLEAATGLGLSVLDEPVCSHGRIELVRWLREQTVSRSLHRYGNIVYG